MSKDQFYLIALGANLPSAEGPPEVTLRSALEALAKAGARAVVASRLFATPCFPAGAGPDYVNAAARLCFDGGAEAFLALLHRIEAAFGREREQRWGQRVLDLDLIAAGDDVLPDEAGYRAWLDLPLEEQKRRGARPADPAASAIAGPALRAGAAGGGGAGMAPPGSGADGQGDGGGPAGGGAGRGRAALSRQWAGRPVGISAQYWPE